MPLLLVRSRCDEASSEDVGGAVLVGGGLSDQSKRVSIGGGDDYEASKKLLCSGSLK